MNLQFKKNSGNKYLCHVKREMPNDTYFSHFTFYNKFFFWERASLRIPAFGVSLPCAPVRYSAFLTAYSEIINKSNKLI